MLNNYLRIVYRNPTDIYRCGLELLSHDNKLKGYLRVQELISNSKPINEIGGLAFYDNIYSVINEIKKLENFVPKIGLLINGSKIDEHKSKSKFSEYFKDLDYDVKSYLRVKGLEYDLVILKDFWDFLFYYKNNFSFLYRMVYMIISRGKLGVFIPYPQFINDEELEKIYSILLSHSKNQNFVDLINELNSCLINNIEKNNKVNEFKISMDVDRLNFGYKMIEIITNVISFLSKMNF